MFWRHRLQLVVVLLAATGCLWGQLERSSIEGTVTDPQGADVVDASVAVTSQGTNITLSTKTNGTGYYQVIGLVPGKYTVRIEAPGFSVMESHDIDALAGHAVRVDAALSVGTSSQRVDVTEAASPLVETSAANFSTSVPERMIAETPLAGRDLQQLVYLLPGVQNAAGPPGSNFGFSSQYGTFPDPTHAQGSDVSVNGGQAGANAWYLDGNLNLSGLVENMAVNPSPDAVTEFQAITEGVSAQYGRTGGGVFNVVLKSGTNSPHGDLYEYFRNSATNARNPFTSIDAAGNLIPDRVLHYNDFGGTFGGPVRIPKLYNGKDKTFFFVSVDRTILHLTGDQVFSVPTQQMRTGNFSEDPSVANYGLYIPSSTVGPNANGTFSRTAISGSQIPANLMDPVAKFFVNSYPLPNYVDPLSGCPMGHNGYAICDNYLGTIGSSQDPWNISAKVDHQLSEKSRLFVELLTSPGTYNIYRTAWTGPTVPYTGFGGNTPFTFTSEVAGIGHTYIASPTLFNEFRLSFSRQVTNTHPNQAGFPNSITDLPEVQKVLAPSQIFLSQFTPSPTFSISMPGGTNSTFGSPGWINQRQANQAYTILDDVTKIIGKHTIKTGFMYRLDQQGRQISDPSTLAFTGGITQNPLTGLGGDGLAQFEMGAVANSGTGITSQPYSSFPYWGLYIQDEYRVTPNLTLNIGLRDDMIFWWKSRDHPESNFCLTCPNSATGLPGEMVYEGQSPLIPKGGPIAPPNLADLAPRFSFAWNPFHDQKTVVRGGYNLMYTNAINAFNNIGQGIQPGANWQSFSNWTGSFYPQCGEYSGQCEAFPLSDTTTNKANLTIPPIPANGQPPAANYSPSYGSSIQFYYPPEKDPQVQMWNLEIQREVTKNMVLTVGYAGNHGTHLAGEAWRSFNQVPIADRIQYKTGINANVPISNYFSGSAAALLEQVWGSNSLPLSILLSPYPFYSWLGTQTMYDGTSKYNALNIRLQERLSHGMSFLVAYTYSKKIYNASVEQLASQLFNTIALSRPGIIGGRASTTSSVGGTGGINGGGYQDYNNRNLDSGIGYDDIPQMLNVSYSYDVPFGKGRTWLNHGGALVDGAIGGWRLSGNFNAQSGVPLSISGPCNQLTCRPNLVGNPSAVSGGQSQSDWINAAAFTPVFGTNQSFWANPNPNAPQEYVFGTAGEYLPGLRSPGFWNLDASLAKDFHFTEQKYLQFRWELYNALNHQNLGYPNTNYCLPPGPDGQTNLVQQAGCSFGRITNIQTDPRSLQFALKFIF